MPLFHLFQFVKGKANSVFQSQKEKERKKNTGPVPLNTLREKLANDAVGIFKSSLHLSTTLH